MKTETLSKIAVNLVIAAFIIGVVLIVVFANVRNL